MSQYVEALGMSVAHRKAVNIFSIIIGNNFWCHRQLMPSFGHGLQIYCYPTIAQKFPEVSLSGKILSPDAVSTDGCSEYMLAVGTAPNPAGTTISEVANAVAVSLSHRDLT